MRLISALLVKDEAAPDRYLRRVLERCSEFSDEILVLDDGSTDETVAVAQSFPKCLVKQRPPANAMWGAETPARAELWERATKRAKGGWVLIVDADMLLEGDPRPYCYSWDAGCWAWPLADCWDDEDRMRVDGPWAIGAQTPRPWLFNLGALPKEWTPHWSGRGIHAGHFPDNWPLPAMVSPTLWWRHLSYCKPEHRNVKSQQYQAVLPHLTEFERMHAASISDR